MTNMHISECSHENSFGAVAVASCEQTFTDLLPSILLKKPDMLICKILKSTCTFNCSKYQHYGPSPDDLICLPSFSYFYKPQAKCPIWKNGPLSPSHCMRKMSSTYIYIRMLLHAQLRFLHENTILSKDMTTHTFYKDTRTEDRAE